MGRFVGENQKSLGALPAVLYERSALLQCLLSCSQLWALTKTKGHCSYYYHLSFLLQESALKANRFSQSVKVVHDRLHLQIQKREAENNKLKEHVKVMNTHFIVSGIK